MGPGEDEDVDVLDDWLEIGETVYESVEDGKAPEDDGEFFALGLYALDQANVKPSQLAKMAGKLAPGDEVELEEDDY